MWDKERIQRLIAENDKAVFRGILAIHARQTASEQSAEATIESNGVGFNYADARLGGYYADYLKRRGCLTGHHLEKARRMLTKYWRQLAEIANERQPQAVESKANAARFEEADRIDASLAKQFRAREEGEDVGNYLEAKMVFEEINPPRASDWA